MDWHARQVLNQLQKKKTSSSDTLTNETILTERFYGNAGVIIQLTAAITCQACIYLKDKAVDILYFSY